MRLGGVLWYSQKVQSSRPDGAMLELYVAVRKDVPPDLSTLLDMSNQYRRQAKKEKNPAHIGQSRHEDR